MKYPKYRKDLTNRRFSNLKVLAFNPSTKKWVCQCECGNILEVITKNLTMNRVKSCGCKKYSRKYNNEDKYPKLAKIYYETKRHNQHTDWIDWKDFKNWALKNGYMEQLSYRKITKGIQYSKENLIFGIKFNKKFLPIKEAKDWKIYCNQDKGEFLIRFRYNKATIKEEHIKTVDELCKKHIQLYNRYFHKKSFFSS